jgi:hypothetical protein
MKSTFSTLALLLGCAVAAAGCSSKVIVRDISGPAKPVGEIFDGVPMQFADRQQLTVFAKQPDGSYKQVHTRIYAMPDQSRLFAVRVDSDALANNTLTLAFYDDGTPKTVGLTTTSQGQAALTQLGTSAAAIATSAATYDQQRQAAAQKAFEQQQTLQAKQLGSTERDKSILAYRQALEDVIVQQAKVDGLAADTTAANTVKEQSDLLMFKLKANQAARVLGVTVPYPNVEMQF